MKKEQRFIYVIGLCFIFILFVSFILTLLNIIDLKIVNEIQLTEPIKYIINISLFFVNIFFIFSLTFKKLNIKLWIYIFSSLLLSIILSYFLSEETGIVASGIIYNICIIIAGFTLYKNKFSIIILRLGIFSLIISLYQQISGFIKIHAFSLNLYQCNVLTSIIYSIDLYLFYLLLLKVVKTNELVLPMENSFRFARFLKETCKEILKNRQMEDVSDLNDKQRRVFALLVWSYTILQYIVIIGVNVLINKFTHYLGAFFIGTIELIIAGIALELFRLVLGKTFHDDKIKVCNIVSFIVFFGISRFALPLQISLFANICVSAIMAYIIHIIIVRNDDYMNLKGEKQRINSFKLEKNCNPDILKEICRYKNMSAADINLLVEYYAENKSYKDLQMKHSYSERHIRRMIRDAEEKFYK